jgi:hypothetical protein
LHTECYITLINLTNNYRSRRNGVVSRSRCDISLVAWINVWIEIQTFQNQFFPESKAYIIKRFMQLRCIVVSFIFKCDKIEISCSDHPSFIAMRFPLMQTIITSVCKNEVSKEVVIILSCALLWGLGVVVSFCSTLITLFKYVSFVLHLFYT